MNLLKSIVMYSLTMFFFFSCSQQEKMPEEQKEFKIDFTKYTLDNGLQVIFHIDRSDPVVAVALTVHVGSAREKEGKTGFAHLFEHLLFLESENLGKGGLDKMSARIGGSGANGSTNRDRTNYYQTVPNDALEKMIWAEADKLGFFINTVTDVVLSKEKQVVKNEKRQSYDNRPYGQTDYVISKNLYPKDHPYNWQVIGSLQDLQNATLQDVKDFFNRWYITNNVILTVSGDFNEIQVKEWIKKYFGEIKKGEEIPSLEKQVITLKKNKKLYHEDNFATLPELTLTWPSVYKYHPDSYALTVLATYLSEGKNAPFYKVLVENKKLTAKVNMYSNTSEISGEFSVDARGFEGVDLNKIQSGFNKAFAKFEKEGISKSNLKRIKAGQETRFYNSLSSVLGKGFYLAQYQIYANNPGFINQDVKNILAVTTEDVKRVYEKYIKGKNCIATSFVPKGKINLVLDGSLKAKVVEEKIVKGAEKDFNLDKKVTYKRTPSSFDRTIQPAYGESPSIKIPEIWENKMDNGLKAYGIQNNEVPLVQFNLVIKGGLLLENAHKIGVSNLVAELMNKGTKTKTPQKFEEAIKELGATINIYVSNEDITIAGSCLARNYEKTFSLVKEMLLEPRWDKNEFELAQKRVISQIKQQTASPNRIADNYFNVLIYGKDHILSNNILGTENSLTSITIDDLKTYYDKFISPSVSNFHIVGDIKKEVVIKSLETLGKNWKSKEINFPKYKMPTVSKSKVYFYDVPGAKQSVLRIGYPALAKVDPDYYPAYIMNYRLGGGSFASQLTQQLRESKGYTYGISSRFIGSTLPGTFRIASGVRSNVTLESITLVKKIMDDYGVNYNENDLAVTKGFLIKSNARAFETMRSKLSMLKNISSYGWAYDYSKQREKIVNEMTVTKVKKLVTKYLDSKKMKYLIVGDATTQLSRLKDLGFGDVILLNKKAN